ncbi:hypothetical protein I601_1508 [Nocardioides dokdonensis FR1436]|uniref:O-Glycosyl hydrolase family 30 n=1 Tax=Nocardioides dokdonensis FR1436 TaxID=1300347 RepID=A0A1A9GK09_9ACTN|nr:hypothetical protein [Nocardioides dokdonensis]ANH37943.1 hypothetical protein I601_1508 [Nocardioides dokdonensis FR1436]
MAPTDGPVDDVVVQADDLRQPWRGVGAALTDATVTELREQPALIGELFDPSSRTGARLQWVRLPLSATDMSTRNWGWRWNGRRARPDPDARAAVRVLRDQVLPVAPDLAVVASPWTALPRFKSNLWWHGGSLRAGAVNGYGRMLVSQARWLLDHGVPLQAMTLANEPGHVSDYPTMLVSDTSLARLASRVGPQLAALGVELWGLDHNWADRPRLDATGYDGLAAASMHCYAGQPAQAADLPVPWLMTECTGTTDTAPSTFRWDAEVLLDQASAAGNSGLLLWNLVLEEGWAGSFGGCRDCRGLLTTPRGGGTGWRAEPEHLFLAHVRRGAPPGARVAGSTSPSDLTAVAFVRGDRVAVVGHNPTDRTRSVRFSVAGTGAAPETVQIGPGELYTWVRQAV